MKCSVGLWGVATALLLGGCDVEPVDLEPIPVPRGERGVLVVNTDYHSSSIAALNDAGEIVSQHVISSASAPPGLSAALSGDVVLPSTAAGEEAVLIDRYPAGVLTWVDLASASVRAQLSVSTGFASNPHDYVPVSPSKAYVTRFAPNLDPGEQPHDIGHDVLVIDPGVPEISGRIDLMAVLAGEAEGLYPRADRALILDGLLRVLVVVFDAAYRERADSRLVSIDPGSDRVVAVHRFSGLTSCAALAVSPSDDELAVACNGAFGRSLEDGFVDAGIVRIRVAGPAVEEIARYRAADIAGAQISMLSYTSHNGILFTTYGRFSADRSRAEEQDTLRWLDLETGEASVPLLETRSTPFSLGDVRCRLAAGACFVADAETLGGVVHRFEILSDGRVGRPTRMQIDRVTGLPPRYLGEF